MTILKVGSTFKLKGENDMNMMDLKRSFLRYAQLFVLLLPTFIFATNGTMSGTGTPIDPFLVADYSDLEAIGTGSYVLSAVYRLSADIDASASASENSNAGFVPIGNSTTNFTGTFHGAGHVIKHLYINRPTTEYVGLFGYTSGSTIDSVGLINNTISGQTSVGGIAGYNSGGISFCFNTGSVNSATTRVGGISGQNYKGAISQCYNTGNISGTDYSVGGISGYNDSGAISYCYNTGNVTGIPYVGGIAGVSSGTTTNCYNSGSVTGSSNVGAIIGSQGTSSTAGIISNCYWDSLTSNQTIGYGSNSGAITNVMGLTTSQMRNIANLSNLGSFTSTWTIRPDSTYPGLLGLANAPFAFADSLVSPTKAVALSAFLLNDCDIKTARSNLTLRVTSASAGTTDSVALLTFPANSQYGTVITVVYRVGEVRTADTLWGNTARALITFDSIALPGAVTLSSPTAGATGVSITPTLTWVAGPGTPPMMYLVKVSTTSGFSSFVINDSTTNPTYTVSAPLSNNTTYSWEVAAKNAAGISSYTSSSFTTIVATPGPVALSAPTAGAIGVSITPTLTWTAGAGGSPTLYLVKVSTSNSFGSFVINDSTTNPTYTVSASLSNNTTYSWEVAAKNAAGVSANTISNFTTIVASTGAVALTAPTGGSTGVSITPTLAWNAPTGGTPVIYLVKVSTVSGFSSLLINDSTTNLSYAITSALLNNTTYFWEVAAKNAAGISAFSASSFTTIVAAPGVTTLLTPSNAAANVSINPVLSWNKVIGADSYRLQMATDSLFSAPVIYDTTLSDTTKLSGALTNNLKYFWRVESENAGGVSPWSSIASFTTIVAVPSALTLKTPSMGDTVKADSALLTWSTGTPSVDRYWVQYAADSAFTSPTSDSSYTDTTMLVRSLHNNANFWWHIKAHNMAGWGAWSVKSEFVVKLPSTLIKLSAIPKTFSFNVSGRDGSIHYALPKAENVFLRIFNLKGQVLNELVNTSQNPGYYSVTLPRCVLAPGQFIVAFNAGEFRRSSLFLPMK